MGSRSWTGWKAAQLRNLYLGTAAVLASESSPRRQPAAETPEMIEGAGYLRYDLPEEREQQERWLGALQPSELQLHMESFVGFDRLTVLAHDRKGFLADFVGCLYAEGLCILHAQIRSTPDGRVLDVFNLQCDSATSVPFRERVEGVRKRWQKLQDGDAQVEDMVAERVRSYPPKPTRPSPRRLRIVLDNSISPRYTVLEVDAPESLGLLHRAVRVLAAHDVSIFSASISTLIDQARDVFYLTDSRGGKLTSPQTCEAIRTALAGLFAAAADGPTPAAGDPPAVADTGERGSSVASRDSG